MNTADDVKKYVEICQETFWQNIFQFETQYLIEHLQGCRNILSVGCGPAIIEGKLSNYGFHVTGLDISAEALKCAPDSIRTFAGSAESMPFAESSFDAVIYVVSLQFIDDYRKALQQTFKVLRPNGRIILMLLNPESDFFKNRLEEPDSYVNRMRHKSLDAIEDVVRERFTVQTEYILGVEGHRIFESHHPREAALYVINGTRKSQ
ncbi:MAG: class I SAM-dependent methyltransferase [Smithella sp.]|nr:class I SAM-dependent methyltransferase [Smithella sp.]HOU51332.1 class I SAM-dependent methyltransferase [Smithella sp.]HQG66144.1 class I SAM-dependent methyltransferase [Smithella sp.]HQI73341.1 class I SAM-dependent methyltransferase [Smithella sp.]